MDKKHICRVCAVEKKVKRSKSWVAIGTCPYCGEKHVLYVKESA